MGARIVRTFAVTNAHSNLNVSHGRTVEGRERLSSRLRVNQAQLLRG